MPKPLSEPEWLRSLPAGWHIRRVGDVSPIFVVFYGKKQISVFQDEAAAKCALNYWEARMAAGITPHWTIQLAQACLTAIEAEKEAAMKARLAAMEAQLAKRDKSVVASQGGKERQKKLKKQKERLQAYVRTLAATAPAAIRKNKSRIHAWMQGKPGKPGTWAYKDADGKLIRECPGRSTIAAILKTIEDEASSKN
jgi:hypothetical protein